MSIHDDDATPSVICPLCRGRGTDVEITCRDCRGTGYSPNEDNPFGQCRTCAGEGTESLDVCPKCDGDGVIEIDEPFDFDDPDESEDPDGVASENGKNRTLRPRERA